MNRLNDLSFRINIFEDDYLIVEFIIYSFIARFESVERRRDRERDELIEKIKNLQDRVVSLESRIADSADYVNERLEEAPKMIKCAYTGVEEEPIESDNPNHPDQEQPEM
jgi:hypothetical protein